MKRLILGTAALIALALVVMPAKADAIGSEVQQFAKSSVISDCNRREVFAICDYKSGVFKVVLVGAPAAIGDASALCKRLENGVWSLGLGKFVVNAEGVALQCMLARR